MKLKEKIAEALYKAHYNNLYSWEKERNIDTIHLHRRQAEAIMPIIEEFGKEMFAQGVDEFLGAEKDLPTIDEFIGSDPDFTGDMSTKEFLARQRGKILNRVKMEATKELMDCELSDGVIRNVQPPCCLSPYVCTFSKGEQLDIGDCFVCKVNILLKAQQEKYRAWAEEQVKAKREKVAQALVQYHHGYISGERAAEMLGMNVFEFFELTNQSMGKEYEK